MLYYSESERRSGVATWVRRGMELGSKILYTEAEGELQDRSLSELLRDEPAALEAMDRGRIEVVCADRATYDPHHVEVVVDNAISDGYPSVRWSGDATTAWGVIDRGGYAVVEQAIDELCMSRPLSAMCQYPGRECVGAFGFLARSHGAGVRDQLFQAAPVKGGLAVAGDLDVLNEDVMRSLLMAGTTKAGCDGFVIDLSQVDFLDVTGARAMLSGTRAYRARGGKVRLHAPRPHIARVICLLGIHRAEGFQLQEA